MKVGGPLERVVSYNGERATLRGHGLKKCRWGGERQQLLRAERVVEIERGGAIGRRAVGELAILLRS